MLTMKKVDSSEMNIVYYSEDDNENNFPNHENNCPNKGRHSETNITDDNSKGNNYFKIFPKG